MRKLSTGETHQLGTERARRNVPFRVFATKFGVSVWRAHRLCSGRSCAADRPAGSAVSAIQAFPLAESGFGSGKLRVSIAGKNTTDRPLLVNCR
jgi:hypothetical protein